LNYEQIGMSINDFVENIGNMVHVLDESGHLLFANNISREILDDPLNESGTFDFISQFTTGNDSHRFRHMLVHVIEQQIAENIQLILKTGQDNLIIVGYRFMPHQFTDGRQVITCVGHDITSFMESHAELERMFRLSRDMLSIIDADGQFLRVNPAWEDILGYSLEDINGKLFSEFIHPDDVEITQDFVSQMQNGGQQSRLINRYRHIDGSYRTLSWNVVSYAHQERYYCVTRDITSFSETIHQLEQAQNQLQAILDNSGTLIYFKDMNGRYVRVNPQMARILEHHDEDVIGHFDTELLPADVATIIQQHEAQVIESNISQQFEEIMRVNGRDHTFLATKFLIHDSDSTPLMICSIATDITYRKTTEMQLMLRNQAIENSPSAISIADATLPDMPLIYINPTFEKNTGYSALEVIGQNCRFLQGNDRDQPELESIRQALRAEQPITVTLRNYKKSGKLFYNELRLAPIHDITGKLTHFVGISTDVTDRVETERKIKDQYDTLIDVNQDLALARREAEDATKLKSQFLATMSHELRTPLNAIIGYTEIQLAGMTGDLTEEQSDYQKRVLTNADHLLQLINDILDLSKIEAGRMDLVNKQYDLEQWIREVESQTRGLAEDKELEFITTLDERMPKQLVGDPARLKQVAINLLSNAIKFTEDGQIKLTIRRHGEDAWKLIVSDSGMGIAPHLQETIFEEFRQVDSSSQRKKGGTGLGLSIVKKLSLMMGGTIRLQSDLDKGSTFTVILPLIVKFMNQTKEGE